MRAWMLPRRFCGLHSPAALIWILLAVWTRLASPWEYNCSSRSELPLQDAVVIKTATTISHCIVRGDNARVSLLAQLTLINTTLKGTLVFTGKKLRGGPCIRVREGLHISSGELEVKNCAMGCILADGNIVQGKASSTFLNCGTFEGTDFALERLFRLEAGRSQKKMTFGFGGIHSPSGSLDLRHGAVMKFQHCHSKVAGGAVRVRELNIAAGASLQADGCSAEAFGGCFVAMSINSKGALVCHEGTSPVAGCISANFVISTGFLELRDCWAAGRLGKGGAIAASEVEVSGRANIERSGSSMGGAILVHGGRFGFIFASWTSGFAV